MKRTSKNNSDSFFTRVHDVCRQIPFGRVSSYGAIARYLGMTRSARMVGWALNQSFKPGTKDFVPAHRVVNRNGQLTGSMHFGGPNVMADLLKSEGIKVEKNQVVDFKKYFWDPCSELDRDID